MTAKDRPVSKPATDAFREGHDRIFGSTRQAKPTANDRQSHLDCIWDALCSYRENCIPEGDPAHDAEWSDICTAMAWIEEDLGDE